MSIFDLRRKLLGIDITAIISSIDSEIAALRQARNLLAGHDGHLVRRGPKPGSSPKKPTISAEGRARIAAAQRARWAKQKRSAKTAA